MIIIYEGADGVGKTTAVSLACEVLLHELRVTPHVLHRGPPTRDVLVEYTADIEDIPEDEWVICDRWHWGELIYGPLYRGKSELTGAGHRAVDEFLARKGAYVVHLDAPTQTVMERVKIRGDDYIMKEHLPFIISEYRRIRELDSPVHRITDVNVSKANVIAHIKGAQRIHATRNR